MRPVKPPGATERATEPRTVAAYHFVLLRAMPAYHFVHTMPALPLRAAAHHAHYGKPATSCCCALCEPPTSCCCALCEPPTSCCCALWQACHSMRTLPAYQFVRTTPALPLRAPAHYASLPLRANHARLPRVQVQAPGGRGRRRRRRRRWRAPGGRYRAQSGRYRAQDRGHGAQTVGTGHRVATMGRR